ncbi:hypothetical protein GCM10022214_62120 [Actinomadura miaoliensis]|uniref:Serine hydrolase n=2 Tax=Actinomadura miaoliensis TaxID=430685 RepID=A0ABP7WNK7_9ACTN
MFGATTKRLSRGSLAAAIVAAAAFTGSSALAVPAAQAEVCRHRTGVQHDGGVFPEPFTEDSLCGNAAGASVYASPSKDSAQVGVLDTTTSWFLCWRRGQSHEGGNDVWYYTQGDRALGDPARRGFGFVPASKLHTTVDPGDSLLAPCPDVPSEPAVGYMVLDRKSGASLQNAEHRRFRSASLIKLLIAIDYLEKLGPGRPIPEGDAGRLRNMLRSSDDDAASALWTRSEDAGPAIVTRMATKIGLTDTSPPADAGKWGYTATSAADVVKTYRYILEQADPAFRDLVMGHLHQATRCASDGWDQFFGIPSALPGPWAVKQGWSGFGAAPPDQRCTTSAPSSRGTAGIELGGVAMHTSGTYCADDRKIMAVLSLSPAGTSWQTSGRRLTKQAGDLYRASPC